MTNYQIMYETLFNAITETITQLQNAQKATEDVYITSTRTNDDNSPEDNT